MMQFPSFSSETDDVSTSSASTNPNSASSNTGRKNRRDDTGKHSPKKLFQWKTKKKERTPEPIPSNAQITNSPGSTASATSYESISPIPSSKPTKSRPKPSSLRKDAKNLFNLGVIYSSNQNNTKALDYFRRALTAREAIFGPDHPDVAAAHEKIGDILMQMGDTRPAREHLDRALATVRNPIKRGESSSSSSKKKTSPAPKSVVYVKDTKKRLQQQQPEPERLEDVTKRIEQRLKELDAMPPPPLPALLPAEETTWNKEKRPAPSFAPIMEETTDDETSVSVHDKKLSKAHSTASTQSETSIASSNRSRPKPQLKRAGADHKLDKNTSAGAHIQVHDYYFDQGMKYYSDGMVAEAKAHFEKSYRERVVVLGKDNLELNLTREKIGDCAARSGNYAEAQMHYEAVLRNLRKTLGDTSEAVLRILASSGDAYLKAEKCDFAIKCYEEALPVRMDEYGGNHVVVVNILKGLVKAHEEIMKGMKVVEMDKVEMHFHKVMALLKPYTKKDEGRVYWNEKEHFRTCYFGIVKLMGNLYCDAGDHESAMKVFAGAAMMDEVAKSDETNELTHEQKKELTVILHNMGMIHEKFKQFDKALGNYKKSLSFKSEVYGKDHPETLTTFQCLGRLCFRIGKNDYAVRYFDEAVRILKLKESTENHEIIVSLLKDMAVAHARNDHMDKAFECLDQKTTYIKKLPGDHRMDIAETYHRMGCLQYHVGDFEMAIAYHHKALGVKRDIWKMDNEDTSLTLHHLGNCYSAAGMYQKAISTYEESLENSGNSNKALLLNKMGMIHHKMNKLDKAIWCYEQALKNPSLMINDSNDRLCSSLLNNMGNVYFAAGSHKESIECYKKAFDFSVNTENCSTINSTGALYNLGLLHSNRKSYDKAEKCFSEILDMRRTCEDDQDGVMAITMNNLGNAQYKLGNYDEAVQSYRKSLSLKEKSFGKVSKEILGTLSDLGSAYNKANLLDNALECYERALKIIEEQKDSNKSTYSDAKVADLLNMIGNVYFMKNDFSQAMKHFNESLALKQRLFDRNHGEVLRILHSVGLAYCKEGRFDEAKTLLESVLNRCNNSVAKDYSEKGKLLLDLSCIHHAKEDYVEAKKFGALAMKEFDKLEFPPNHPYMHQTKSVLNRWKAEGLGFLVEK